MTLKALNWDSRRTFPVIKPRRVRESQPAPFVQTRVCPLEPASRKLAARVDVMWMAMLMRLALVSEEIE